MKRMNLNGLRTRTMVIFSATFLLLMLLLPMTTNIFFKDYYLRSNENNMRRWALEYIGEERDDSDLQWLRRASGGQVYLFRPGQDVQGWREDNPSTAPSRPIIAGEMVKRLHELAATRGARGYFMADEDRMYFAVMAKKGQLLVMTKQMGLLEEAEKMFDAFILRVAAVIYLIGIVVIYFITKHLTKPILDMAQMTAKVATLEFGEALEPKGADETRQLMASINTMSDNLKGTIEALNQANEQLAQELSKERSLEKMRRQFVSDVSHELKNPLAMVIGYADGLKQGIVKTETGRQDYYDIILDESQRMNRLVKDLLELSGYESGTFTIERETFILENLVGEVIERFDHVMNDRSIQVMYDDTIGHELYADRLRIHQVLVNLLDNAYKHVNESGTIRIDRQKTEEGLKLTISNTGVLMPEDALEDIWNSFYQVNTQSKGNGLGLAIVKSIVKLHGGRCVAYVKDGFNCFEVVI